MVQCSVQNPLPTASESDLNDPWSKAVGELPVIQILDSLSTVVCNSACTVTVIQAILDRVARIRAEEQPKQGFQ